MEITVEQIYIFLWFLLTYVNNIVINLCSVELHLLLLMSA